MTAKEAKEATDKLIKDDGEKFYPEIKAKINEAIKGRLYSINVRANHNPALMDKLRSEGYIVRWYEDQYLDHIHISWEDPMK